MAELKWAAQLNDCCNRAGVPLSEDQVCVFAGWLAVIELQSQQRIAKLEEALITHGDHNVLCGWWEVDGKCDCGFTETLNPPPPPTPQEE